MTEPTTKECSICGQTKPVEDFHKDSQKKDGRSSWCRPCSKYRSKLAETPMAVIKQQIAVLVAATSTQGPAAASAPPAPTAAALVPEKPKPKRTRKPRVRK